MHMYHDSKLHKRISRIPLHAICINKIHCSSKFDKALKRVLVTHMQINSGISKVIK